MQTRSWKRFMACALATGALLAGCSNEAPAPKPKAAAAPDSRASGKADSVAGGVKVVLLELKRDGPDALMVRWQFRNDTGDKIELTALSGAGMNPWRLSRGVAVRDASGTDYPLLEGASAPQGGEARCLHLLRPLRPAPGCRHVGARQGSASRGAACRRAAPHGRADSRRADCAIDSEAPRSLTPSSATTRWTGARFSVRSLSIVNGCEGVSHSFPTNKKPRHSCEPGVFRLNMAWR